jgi:hypothetical protein
MRSLIKGPISCRDLWTNWAIVCTYLPFAPRKTKLFTTSQPWTSAPCQPAHPFAYQHKSHWSGCTRTWASTALSSVSCFRLEWDDCCRRAHVCDLRQPTGDRRQAQWTMLPRCAVSGARAACRVPIQPNYAPLFTLRVIMNNNRLISDVVEISMS